MNEILSENSESKTKHPFFSNVIAGAIGTFVTLFIVIGISFLNPSTLNQFLKQFAPQALSDQAAESGAIVMEEHSEAIKDREERIIDVVSRMSPAVVSIAISQDVPIYSEGGSDGMDLFEQFFGIPDPFSNDSREIIGEERVEIGGGTGFLISNDGYIVTNRHVVAQEDASYSVITSDGTEFAADIVAKDPIYDIAILKIEGEFPYLQFGNSDDIRVGQSAIAIGNALAEFNNTVSVGVISGLSRDITAGDGLGTFERLEGLIQTDAAINPGNSGGPLMNLDGEVIGMNVAMAGAENIGFALPSNLVKKVAETVQQNGKIIRPFLGVRYLPITQELKERNNLSVDYGVIVIRGEQSSDLAVSPGSAADKAGIEENDILLEIDHVRIDEDHSLARIIREKNVGDTIEIKLLHKGEEKTVQAVLEAFPE